jgi:hypothetical protein
LEYGGNVALPPNPTGRHSEKNGPCHFGTDRDRPATIFADGPQALADTAIAETTVGQTQKTSVEEKGRCLSAPALTEGRYFGRASMARAGFDAAPYIR